MVTLLEVMVTSPINEQMVEAILNSYKNLAYVKSGLSFHGVWKFWWSISDYLWIIEILKALCKSILEDTY